MRHMPQTRPTLSAVLSTVFLVQLAAVGSAMAQGTSTQKPPAVVVPSGQADDFSLAERRARIRSP